MKIILLIGLFFSFQIAAAEKSSLDYTYYCKVWDYRTPKPKGKTNDQPVKIKIKNADFPYLIKKEGENQIFLRAPISYTLDPKNEQSKIYFIANIDLVYADAAGKAIAASSTKIGNELNLLLFNYDLSVTCNLTNW